VEKFGTARQAKDGDTAHELCMLEAWRYWHDLKKMKYLLLFLCNKGYANAPHVTFIRTLPGLFLYCIVYEDVTVRCVQRKGTKLLDRSYVRHYPFLPSTAVGQ